LNPVCCELLQAESQLVSIRSSAQFYWGDWATKYQWLNFPTLFHPAD